MINDKIENQWVSLNIINDFLLNKEKNIIIKTRRAWNLVLRVTLDFNWISK